MGLRLASLAALAAAASLAPAAAGDGRFTPPQAGSLVTWAIERDGERETRAALVVASGADFTLYLDDIRTAGDQPEHYTVEFSGVYAIGCTEPMPSMDIRDTLATLWPLQEGNFAGALDDLIYSVGAPLDQTGERYALEVEHAGRTLAYELTVSPSMLSRLTWPDGTAARVLSVEPPAEPGGARVPRLDQLGRCADLF